MMGQIVQAIAAVIILIVLVIVFAISTVTLGTMAAIGLVILAAGLFALISRKVPFKIGGIIAVIGFILFLLGYMGWL